MMKVIIVKDSPHEFEKLINNQWSVAHAFASPKGLVIVLTHADVKKRR